MHAPRPSRRADAAMNHLGDVAAQLVDGQLDHDARDRALSHLTRCPRCRGEVDAQRTLKAVLARLDPPPAAPELAGRLVALGQLPAPIPAPLREPATQRPRRDGRPPSSTRPNRRAARSRPPRRRRRGGATRASTLRIALAGAASLTLVALTTAVATAGPDSGNGQRVRPAVARFVVDHAGTTGEVPLTDPAVGAAVSVSYVP